MGVGPAKPSKGILTKKIGPLPTWGWMAVGLGLAVIIASVNKDKKASAAADKQNMGDGGYGGTLDYGAGYGGGGIYVGGSQRPPVIFQSYNTQVAETQLPPLGGRPFPPCAPGTPCPAPPAPGRWVQVPGGRGPKGMHGNPLERLARELFGTPDPWRAIWDAPENAGLRARRKTPMRLQAGDRVWVPDLGPAGAPCPPPPPPGIPCPPGPGGPAGPIPCPPPPGRPPMIPPPPPPGWGGHSVMPGHASGRRHRR